MEPEPDSKIRRQCGTMAAHHRLCETIAEYRATRAAMERRTQDLIATGCMMREKRLLFRIRVVVHVLYHDENQRLSASQVRSQIQVLNRDFRRKNGNRRSIPRPWRGLAADVGVEFELASVDPFGNPTRGITYHKTDRDSFGTGDSVKNLGSGGAEAWDTRRYLNIWVAPLSGGLLGYAQFPGGPEATDGVVISYTAFGLRGTTLAPFHRGRTATHEIGHYFNLYHLWGDMQDCGGTDHCCDTPPQQFPNYGTPSFPKISCDNGPHGDMFMNYMDYSDDEVLALFTEAQAARIVATMTGPRSSLDPSPTPLDPS